MAVCVAACKDMRIVTFDLAALGAGIIVNGCVRTGGGGFQRIPVHRCGGEMMHGVFHVTAGRACTDMVCGVHARVIAVGMLLRFVIAVDGEI